MRGSPSIRKNFRQKSWRKRRRNIKQPLRIQPGTEKSSSVPGCFFKIFYCRICFTDRCVYGTDGSILPGPKCTSSLRSVNSGSVPWYSPFMLKPISSTVSNTMSYLSPSCFIVIVPDTIGAIFPCGRLSMTSCRNILWFLHICLRPPPITSILRKAR